MCNAVIKFPNGIEYKIVEDRETGISGNSGNLIDDTKLFLLQIRFILDKEAISPWKTVRILEKNDIYEAKDFVESLWSTLSLYYSCIDTKPNFKMETLESVEENLGWI
jgi:hypothetical protein